MMKNKNRKETSKKVAKVASEILRNTNSTKKEKMVAASALSQTKKKK
jgi:hypothetical protein